MANYMKIIAKVRKEKKVTQQAIADYLHISQQQWSDYERCKNELPIRYLIQICVLLNVSADYILGLAEHPQTPA